MLTVSCPGCSKPLSLAEEVCPHCRRPRDENEIEKGHEDARQEAIRLKDRPRRILVRVTAAAAVAGALTLAWSSRDAAAVRFQAAWTDFNVEVQRARDPLSHAKPQTTADPSLLSDVAASLSNPENPVNPAKPANPAPVAVHVAPPVETPDATPPAPPPAPMQDMECMVYGVVYDLATKKSVAHARIIFRTADSATQEAVTNENGHYFIPLRKNPGFLTTAMIEARGYRRGLLEDKDPPFRERSFEDRVAVMDETLDSDLDPVPIRYPPRARLISLDLVLVPEQKK
ncbi:MAG: carboxypeptidase-like regulatory domain-containing protein [Elusimicrobiota bacterium]